MFALFLDKLTNFFLIQNELRLKAINALIDSYSQKFMTIPAKIKLLQTLQQTLLKKSLAKLPGLVLDYRPFWTEAIGIVRREKRFEAVASEGLLTDLLGKLVSFLHTARAYIPWHTENYDLIELSATMMRDLRRPVSVEGLLILVNCLDTNFDRYDECLPSWFELWTKLDHNVHWDCCWLTIFARARKHTKTFDWSTTTNFLYSKARLLLQLPTSANSNGAVGIGGDYPHSFPPIYAKFIVCSTDQRKTSLAKLAKLIHSVSLRNSLVVSPEIVTLTAPALIIDNSCSQNIPGIHPTEALVQKNVVDWGLFLQSIRPYFYASNSGAWSSNLSYFFSMFTIQICRHVGRSVAFELLGSTTSIPKLYERPIHLPTLQYSCGILIPYVLENLYGKNPMLSQLCAVCIKNLLGVDPSLGNALVVNESCFNFNTLTNPIVVISRSC